MKRHWFSEIAVSNLLRNKLLCSTELKKLGDGKPPLQHAQRHGRHFACGVVNMNEIVEYPMHIQESL